MGEDFLKSYLESFNKIEGMFSPDAALMFMAYNGLINSAGVSGDVLEIGVHHGLSSIAIASLRGAERCFVAVDLFENLQSENVSKSGSGNKGRFIQNMRSFYQGTNFIRLYACKSSELELGELGSGFSFCHIDGGHSAGETYYDLQLCTQIMVAGGLLALDDYFNPSFPGVAEGAIKFMMDHPSYLKPVAIGFNKVLFQKLPAGFDVNAMFSTSFPQVPKTTVTLWEKPAYLFGSGFTPFFDIQHSAPNHLVANRDFIVNAKLEPSRSELKARRGETIYLPVKVVNESTIPFQWSDSPFGLSYHLLSHEGKVLQFDNIRSFFRNPLMPHEEQIMNMTILAPEKSGSYKIEIDIVWEGIAWLKSRGCRTRIIDLTVS